MKVVSADLIVKEYDFDDLELYDLFLYGNDKLYIFCGYDNHDRAYARNIENKEIIYL